MKSVRPHLLSHSTSRTEKKKKSRRRGTPNDDVDNETNNVASGDIRVTDDVTCVNDVTCADDVSGADDVTDAMSRLKAKDDDDEEDR